MIIIMRTVIIINYPNWEWLSFAGWEWFAAWEWLSGKVGMGIAYIMGYVTLLTLTKKSQVGKKQEG